MNMTRNPTLRSNPNRAPATARAVFRALLALALLLGGSLPAARAQSFDGLWQGSTAQDRPLSFTASGNAIASFSTELQLSGCAQTTFRLSLSGGQSFSGSTFSIALTGIDGRIEGAFSSADSVSGQIVLNAGDGFLYCPEQVKIPWTAARSGDLYTRIWWDPQQAGQGVQIFQSGAIISGAWYHYDANGDDRWVTFLGTLNGDSVTATLLQFTGPAPGGEWDSSLVTSRPVGVVTLTFASAAAATFDYMFNDGASGSLRLVPFALDTGAR